jgi:phosphoserine aminotransferase
MKKFNFSAGPAILPKEVMAESAEAVVDFGGIGFSILEISHRSKEFVAVMEEAQSLAKELLSVPEGYEVLFLQGGASTQFAMASMNFLGDNEKAGYVDTGSWSTKAIKEAKRFGETLTLASSKDRNFNYIPKGYDIADDLKYVHITSNNTIFGTEFHSLPDTKVPFIADMSSNIFSKPVDVSRYGMIYAGAQKNMGPAGTTLVILSKDLIDKQSREVPTMLDYNTHIGKSSMFNTPPVFAIYVSMLTMRWVKAQGGVAAMQKVNEDKANLLYSTLDNSDIFYSPVDTADRSNMNATFLIKNTDLEQSFINAAAEAGCMSIKGHRSVGGFRASIYNAMPREGVETLCEVIKAFEAKHG